jgi:hypothetical protein
MHTHSLYVSVHCSSTWQLDPGWRDVETPPAPTLTFQNSSLILLLYPDCAAKAFYSCPAIISRRPGSQDTSKEAQLNSEEDSRIKQARSHVTLEKSSQNYKPSEE